MINRDRHEEGARERTDAVEHMPPSRRGERLVSYELINVFLPGKQLYMGLPEPYQFVEVPGSDGPSLLLLSCSCSAHRGRAGTHILNTSEVSLVLECGPERVWVFITIPARYRAKYDWFLPSTFGWSVDEELCGFLVSSAEQAA